MAGFWGYPSGARGAYLSSLITGAKQKYKYKNYDKNRIQTHILLPNNIQCLCRLSFDIDIQTLAHCYWKGNFSAGQVAGLGGTLGLFLGFSFMTIWDGAQFICSALQKRMKNIR